MGARELLARGDFDFDAESVELDDAAVLESLEPEVREWWVEEFGEYVPDNGGFFTPPQKQAIPLVRDGENASSRRRLEAERRWPPSPQF